MSRSNSSWRILMNAENKYLRSHEQKEQKGVSEGAFAPFATIADGNRKVRNTHRGRGANKSGEWVKSDERQSILALKDTQEQGKGDTENVEPWLDMETVLVFSKVLNREVFVSWEGENPESILFDGIPYSVAEIAKLKELQPLTPEDLRAIHDAKCVFEGELNLPLKGV